VNGVNVMRDSFKNYIQKDRDVIILIFLSLEFVLDFSQWG